MAHPQFRLSFLAVLVLLVFSCKSKETLNEKTEVKNTDPFKPYHFLYEVERDSFVNVYNGTLMQDSVFYGLMDSCYNNWPSTPPSDFIAALQQLDSGLCDLIKYNMIEVSSIWMSYSHEFEKNWSINGNSAFEKYCYKKLYLLDIIHIFVIIKEALHAASYNEVLDLSDTYSYCIKRANVTDSLPVKAEYKKIEDFVNGDFVFLDRKKLNLNTEPFKPNITNPTLDSLNKMLGK